MLNFMPKGVDEVLWVLVVVVHVFSLATMLWFFGPLNNTLWDDCESTHAFWLYYFVNDAAA